MTQALYDNTGAPVTVRLSETRPIGSYSINLADGSPVGRVDFTDSPEVDGDRIVSTPRWTGGSVAGYRT